MQVERRQSDDVVVNLLPDGSRILLDKKNETVFALNATAGAAWDACSSATTVAELAEKMGQSLDATVSEDLAAAAIAELQDKNLVNASGAPLDGSRRKFIAQVGMAAVPLVVALTMTEQRAYADHAKSAVHRRPEHNFDRDDDHPHEIQWPTGR